MPPMRKHERQGCLRQVLEPADSSPRNPTTPEIQLATILRGRPERALANRHHPLPTRDDTDVEILIILDDRSRLCIDSRARGIFTDGDVDTVFRRRHPHLRRPGRAAPGQRGGVHRRTPQWWTGSRLS